MLEEDSQAISMPDPVLSTPLSLPQGWPCSAAQNHLIYPPVDVLLGCLSPDAPLPGSRTR
jgi:hypothetical protein